ncbi:hypothetical protein [Nocardioides terrisoli]|uniref:hypothetical protein n=1 Tax=Nocardioides terrisoli TaxID=3388267 RepID=UPI00287BBCEB|nr:hypothetical protein [Nocardioides marmorisolisilvae]
MTRRLWWLWWPVLSVALAVVLTGCGSHSESDDAHHEIDAGADTSVCVADAKPISSYPARFPQEFPFPPRTVVYHAEDRGADGVIVSGVTLLPFKQVLAALNGPAQRAGFKVTNGETESHDAEANWTGNGFHGRWAIRESATCPRQTVVQVLAAPK